MPEALFGIIAALICAVLLWPDSNEAPKGWDKTMADHANKVCAHHKGTRELASVSSNYIVFVCNDGTVKP